MCEKIKKDRSIFWAIGLFIVILVWSAFVFYKTMEKDIISPTVNDTNVSRTELKPHAKENLEIKNSSDKIEIHSTIILEKESKKNDSSKVKKIPVLYFVSIAIFSCIAVTALICLTIIIIKSDNGLKFAKLNALNDIKDSDGFVFVKEDSKDMSIEKIEEVTNKSNSDVTSEIQTTKYKNLRADLAKKYMDSIVEV